ncbi:hypothetical protein ABZ312_11455 [Streptomyces sp. NPDC006207]
MLELICYLAALILAAIAVLAPNSPPFDRVRFLAAAFAAYVIPALVHAAQSV